MIRLIATLVKIALRSLVLSLVTGGDVICAAIDQSSASKSLEQVKHLQDFQVVELRRYTIKEGEREHFAQYFETYFPEAFQQLGSIIYGQFLERENHSRFTWIRGFKDMDARATVSAAFYYGPVWKEHRAIMNDRLIDSDDVLLLRPLRPERAITVLPALDPNVETAGAQGIVVAQIFAIKPNSVDAFIPTIGRFINGRGEFYDYEVYEGKAVLVRFLWLNIKPDSCRWEQAFSPDGGKTWETNWTMDFERISAAQAG
jgi:hypothetical protein